MCNAIRHSGRSLYNAGATDVHHMDVVLRAERQRAPRLTRAVLVSIPVTHHQAQQRGAKAIYETAPVQKRRWPYHKKLFRTHIMGVQNADRAHQTQCNRSRRDQKCGKQFRRRFPDHSTSSKRWRDVRDRQTWGRDKTMGRRSRRDVGCECCRSCFL